MAKFQYTKSDFLEFNRGLLAKQVNIPYVLFLVILVFFLSGVAIVNGRTGQVVLVGSVGIVTLILIPLFYHRQMTRIFDSQAANKEEITVTIDDNAIRYLQAVAVPASGATG